jgi:hypothetical protein
METAVEIASEPITQDLAVIDELHELIRPSYEKATTLLTRETCFCDTLYTLRGPNGSLVAFSWWHGTNLNWTTRRSRPSTWGSALHVRTPRAPDRCDMSTSGSQTMLVGGNTERERSCCSGSRRQHPRPITLLSAYLTVYNPAPMGRTRRTVSAWQMRSATTWMQIEGSNLRVSRCCAEHVVFRSRSGADTTCL